jgi:3-oxoacyl-[acyl-carrier protein] reductase
MDILDGRIESSSRIARTDMQSTSHLPLRGKVALVTGAGRNVGKAIALAYARAGADVIVNVRSNREDAELVVREIRGLGRRAVAGLADISSQAAVEEMILMARAE